MVVTAVSRERRCRYPVIDYARDGELEVVDQFFKACSGLRYGERTALARYFGVTERTVQAWQYKEQFPGHIVAYQVIHWVEHGKPMELRPLQATNMF